MAVVGIFPAAGRGERLGSGGPKAFVACAGRALVEWSIEVLESVCDRVVLAVPEGWATGRDRVSGGAGRRRQPAPLAGPPAPRRCAPRSPRRPRRRWPWSTTPPGRS